MWDKLAELDERYEALSRLMADLSVIQDHERLRQYAQERTGIEEIVTTYREHGQVSGELRSVQEMLEQESDEDLLDLIRNEIEDLSAVQDELAERIRVLLIPRDPRDQRSVIVEIRAGTGGDEAGLFAADLYRMYARYAENRGWSVDVLSTNATGIGGLKEIIFEVDGRGAYSRLKFESGVHRVQRVPMTESSGRIHTSTATVAVLPEAEAVEIEINAEDLRVDVFRSRGHGGQSVNTTDSAVRLTHLPTGLVVSCQDERSQLQNRARAMSILRARLYNQEQERLRSEEEEARRSQVGTGERSEKIRTYNFPQNRVTDHRVGLTSHRLQGILEGDLDQFIDHLIDYERAEKLKRMSAAE